MMISTVVSVFSIWFLLLFTNIAGLYVGTKASSPCCSPHACLDHVAEGSKQDLELQVPKGLSV